METSCIPTRIDLLQLVEALAGTIDLMNPAIANHQLRVAHVASRLAEAAGLEEQESTDLLLAALLHDCGALLLSERLEIMQFEFDLDREKAQRHAEAGYRLLHVFPPFARMAQLIRYHHLHWENGRSGQEEEVPLGSHLLHLADRLDVLIDFGEELLGQTETILQKLREFTPEILRPDLVGLLEQLVWKESFWFDLQTVSLHSGLLNGVQLGRISINGRDLLSLAELFSQVIDFRSRFTATHSTGVAATADRLAELLDFSGEHCAGIRLAGYLHDLGKLAVPAELVSKTGPLSRTESNIMKRHSYYTYRILQRIEGLETVTNWAGYHHEWVNGRGYPFHLSGENLPLGARIMAVADVFTATTEERPYRKAMQVEKVMEIIARMARHGTLDPLVTAALVDDCREVDRLRSAAQEKAFRAYGEFEQFILR